jgi:thiol-disulfide isomerase/thioredoxin/outer membrane lipoprotein-sorting protein
MRFSILLLLALSSNLPQGASQDSPTADALPLLNEVSQRYANAKSYHVEAVEERTSSNDLQRDWQKTLFTAIVMPGGRYRYDGRSGFGSALLVSDGITQWDYHIDENLYTQRPAFAIDSDKHRIISQEEFATETAKQLVNQVGRLASRVRSATLLSDEIISLSGRSIECQVVRIGDDDFKAKHRYVKKEQTIWIEKASKVVRRTLSKEQGYMILPGSHAHIPVSQETTTIYPVVELDREEPASSFSFAAPPEAKLTAAFPNQFSRPAALEALDFVGKPAPELRLKSSEGRVTTLSSLRGKPVFIEFWATWCEPCVELMPGLAKLYSETQEKGLVWISIDNDEDPSTAATFMSQEHLIWPNYHDEDGSLGEAFHREGIPLGVLIDEAGKITFYESGYEIPQLQAAIAKLGPQFSSAAPTGTNSK